LGFNFRWLLHFGFGCKLYVTDLVFVESEMLGNEKEIRHQRNWRRMWIEERHLVAQRKHLWVMQKLVIRKR